MSDKTNNNPTIVSATRPPIVVVLGHVDHGKTSILDKIRQTKIAEGEAGGITQHIGAYQVEVLEEPKFRGTVSDEEHLKNRKITFLDTPGHEAFTAIRSRGAKVADIAILVVAAEEGVKPQTKEAIRIIKEADMPFVVAINKIDKEGANPAKVRQELAEQEVQVEDYGGDIPVVELSAKKSEGINELLDMVLLVAELEELTAPISSPAKGVVIESHMNSRRGLIATLIIQEGELKIGDWVSAGGAIGRVKLLEDFLGKSIKVVIASQPCVMLGWETAPKVGQEFQVVSSRESAESLAASQTSVGPTTLFLKEVSIPVPFALNGATGQTEDQSVQSIERSAEHSSSLEGSDQKTNPEKLHPVQSGASTGLRLGAGKKIANLIIKADVQSSLEAIDHALRAIKSEEVEYNIVNYGVGTIGDNDIKNARATSAAIVGFHVGIDASAKQLAERDKINLQTFDIIYELIETVRLIMADLLDPEIRRVPLGKLKILAIFKNSGKSQIVGGKVMQGKIIRGAMIDIIRNGVTLMSGKLGQLQHNKADIAEVSEGLEAGLRFDAQSQPLPQQLIKEGDVLEVYEEEKIKRSI